MGTFLPHFYLHTEGLFSETRYELKQKIWGMKTIKYVFFLISDEISFVWDYPTLDKKYRKLVYKIHFFFEFVCLSLLHPKVFHNEKYSAKTKAK